VGGLIRRYPLISYFVIAYAGTWLVRVAGSGSRPEFVFKPVAAAARAPDQQLLLISLVLC
jgi:hypothetical protein